MEKLKIEGVLLGLKICKELWAQGQLTHETIYENEVLYKEELANFEYEERKANFAFYNKIKLKWSQNCVENSIMPIRNSSNIKKRME